MTKQELISKIGDLEWEDFEVKEAKANLPKSAWETVSAFANTVGGWLVFGVKQNGKHFEIQGVTNGEKIQQDFLNTLRGEKFNVFVPTKQVKYTIDGKTILAFYISASGKKPVYFNTLKNTFIRRGSADQRATREEVDAMFRDQTFGTKTSEAAPGTSRADINVRSLDRYRDYMSRFNPGVSYNRFDETEFLHKLRILDNGICTFGGLLFLGNRTSIEQHFPDFRIDLLEVPGTSYTDAKSRYTFRLDEHENLWEYYFECFARLKQKVDVTYRITSEGFGEELSPGLLAIREALVNMLMHADFFSPAHPRIRIFTDHIDFFNPGGLPKPLEELKAKDISMPRNPIVTKLFRMVRIAENAGFGFDKMDTNWKAYNGTEPEYSIDFDSMMVCFITGTKTRTAPQKEMEGLSEKLGKDAAQNLDVLSSNLDLISEYFRTKFGLNSDEIRTKFGDNALYTLALLHLNPTITAKSAAEKIGVTSRTIENYISKFKGEGILDRKGADKSGFWVILGAVTG